MEKETEKKVTVKLTENELRLDAIAHQNVINQVFEADMKAGVPEHIAQEELRRKAYGHVKRIEDINEALAVLQEGPKAPAKKKKKPLVEVEEDEDEDQEDEDEGN